MPRWVVSSSCLTDETIVADSDAETELATSDQPAELDRKGKGSGDDVALSSRRDDQKTNSVEHNDRTVIRVKNDDDPESGNSDILYSQNLIVREVSLPVSTASTTDNQVINFKRFRKTTIQSGNSFNNLVPFAKHPYTYDAFLFPGDSDYESKEVIEYVREEKKLEKADGSHRGGLI
ncbi:Mre11 complex subunit Nbs1 [Ancistrocladus abbreviatus]